MKIYKYEYHLSIGMYKEFLGSVLCNNFYVDHNVSYTQNWFSLGYVDLLLLSQAKLV